MPKLPDVPSVIRVRWIGTDAADTALGSHITFRYSGAAPSSAQLAAIAPTWGNLWATNMAPVTDTGYTLTLLEIIDLSSSTSAVAEVSMTHAGTRVGAALPLNVAFNMAYITNLRRRGGHWRAEVRAGVQTDLATPQTWSATFVTAFTSAWTGFIGGMQGSLWSGATSMAPVAVQYFGPPNIVKTNASGRVKTVSSQLAVPNVFPISAFVGKTRLGSQRRRLG